MMLTTNVVPVSKRSKRIKKHPPTIKSPLRYPGGKSIAAREIYDLLPIGIDRLCSPFVGGGSLELICAQRGINVKAYDVFEPLVNFWRVLLGDASGLARMARKYHPLSRTQFYALQRRYASLKDQRHSAAAFYALNRSSFSGTTLSGGMSPGHPRFTEHGLEWLGKLKIDRLSVECADFKDSIPKHKGDFLYLDPPYANGGKLYGDRGDCHAHFDHVGLAKILRKRDGWLLSYNDCDTVRDLYDGFTFADIEWAYGMNNSKESNEVLILSNDYARVL